MKKVYLLLLMLATALSSSLHTADHNAAVNIFYQEPDLDKAQQQFLTTINGNVVTLFDLFKQAKTTNDTPTQVYLALAYANIKGPNQDYLNPGELNNHRVEYIEPKEVMECLSKLLAHENRSCSLSSKSIAHYTVDQASRKTGDVYAQFLQIYINQPTDASSSLDANTGFFAASQIKPLLDKAPQNRTLRYALGLALLKAGLDSNQEHVLCHGLNYMDESKYLDISVETKLNFANLRNSSNFYSSWKKLVILKNGTVAATSQNSQQKIKKNYLSNIHPIEERRFKLFDEYPQLEDIADAIGKDNIRIKQSQKASNSFNIYSKEPGVKRSLAKVKVSQSPNLIHHYKHIYEYAKENKVRLLAVKFIIDAVERWKDLNSVAYLIRDLKSKTDSIQNDDIAY